MADEAETLERTWALLQTNCIARTQCPHLGKMTPSSTKLPHRCIVCWSQEHFPRAVEAVD